MPQDAKIQITVKLDDQNFPETIEWEASQSGAGRQKCSSLFISMWDKKEKNTMNLDLWTKEMEIGEMNLHFYQTFMQMADTFQRATNNPEAAQLIRQFAARFAEKIGETTQGTDKK